MTKSKTKLINVTWGLPTKPTKTKTASSSMYYNLMGLVFMITFAYGIITNDFLLLIGSATLILLCQNEANYYMQIAHQNKWFKE